MLKSLLILLQKFSWEWKLTLLWEDLLFHFPSVAFSPFLGVHRNVSYVQHLALLGKNDVGWGHDLVLPRHVCSTPSPYLPNDGPSHILAHCPSLPTTFSWATATKAPENQERPWMKTEKKTPKTLTKKSISSFARPLHGKLGCWRHLGELRGSRGWEKQWGAMLTVPWAGDQDSSSQSYRHCLL